jgi:PAS domain S-box-containing protein
MSSERFLNSENLLSEVGRVARVGGWELDVETGEERWTEESYRIHDIDNEDGHPGPEDWMQFVVPGSKPAIEEALRRAIDDGTPFDMEIELITARGNHRWIRVLGRAHRLDGRTRLLVGIFQDVTANKETELALRDSEEMYRALFTESKDAIMILLPEEGVFSGNPEAVMVFGCRDAKELTSKTFEDLSPERQPGGAVSSEAMRAHVAAALGGGSDFFEWVFRRLDGAEFPATVLFSRVGSGSGVFLQATVRDITSRKKAEKALMEANDELRKARNELIQAEKMAALGRFSTMIAHEVKNPLNIALSGIESLESSAMCESKETENSLAVIKGAVLRADSILETLLEYAKPSGAGSEVIEASSAVKAALDLVRARPRVKDVTIETDLARDLRISADKNHMQQAALHIIDNAIEAMPHGGRLAIKVFKAFVPELPEERAACVIEISDTGVGIPRENIHKVVEPFFTTKEREIGTGLGLFVAKVIAENHHGKLSIESEVGKGTVVRIALPLAE